MSSAQKYKVEYWVGQILGMRKISVKKSIDNSLMLSYALTYSSLLSPTSQGLAVHPFSPEQETCCMLVSGK